MFVFFNEPLVSNIGSADGASHRLYSTSNLSLIHRASVTSNVFPLITTIFDYESLLGKFIYNNTVIRIYAEIKTYILVCYNPDVISANDIALM